jgi:chemotaxis protein MotB
MAQEEEPAPGVPEWVVTFGDMMSLLLTFFIMLVSLSEIKQEEKYQALVESIRKQLGHVSSRDSTTPGPTKPRNSMVQQVANLARAKRQDLMKGGQKVESPTGENKTVQIIREGSRTVIGTTIFFDDFALDLRALEKQKLSELAVKIIGKPQKIEVRGHSSRRPIPPGLPFVDHYDLAFQRARLVRDYLVNELKIEPNRIRMIAAGSDEPLHFGIDPEKLKLNSRVDVFLLDELTDGLTGTADEREDRLIDIPQAGDSP